MAAIEVDRRRGDLAGMTVAVLGATGSLGGACARACAGAGGRVIALARRSAEDGAVSIRLDLRDGETWKSALAELPELDGFVAAAGVLAPRPLTGSPPAAFLEQMEVNFTAQALLVRMLLRERKLRSGASLVFLSSVAAARGFVGHAAYAASKAALCAFVRSLAVELGPQRMRANTVSPGLIESPMAEDTRGLGSEGETGAHAARYPLGPGFPDDVAEAVVFLLSARARWITGTDLVVDGGFSAT